MLCFPHMFTDEQLNQLKQLLKPMNDKLDTLEMNIEALRKESREAHTEIMETLAESNEAHSKEQRQLREKIDHLEEVAHGSKN